MRNTETNEWSSLAQGRREREFDSAFDAIYASLYQLVLRRLIFRGEAGYTEPLEDVAIEVILEWQENVRRKYRASSLTPEAALTQNRALLYTIADRRRIDFVRKRMRQPKERSLNEPMGGDTGTEWGSLLPDTQNVGVEASVTNDIVWNGFLIQLRQSEGDEATLYLLLRLDNHSDREIAWLLHREDLVLLILVCPLLENRQQEPVQWLWEEVFAHMGLCRPCDGCKNMAREHANVAQGRYPRLRKRIQHLWVEYAG